MKKLNFPSEEDMKFINKFVLKRKNKKIIELNTQGRAWTRTSWENKMDYEVNWLGIPIIQNPYDMILMQELIFKIKPDLIIETGIAHGGSLIYYSSLLKLLGKGRVIGVDIDIRSHNRKLIEKHPMIANITMIQGSSIDKNVVGEIHKNIKPKNIVLVILDSDHRKPHVLAELEAYKKIVSKNSYFVVFDTFMPYLVGLDGETKEFKANNAMDAVKEFIKNNKNFKIDKAYNKYFVSSCPDGFLKKVK